MSASREKKQRKGSSAKPVNQEKKATAKYWIIGIACLLVLALLVSVSLVLSSSWSYRNITAMTVGEHKLAAADLNYYYAGVYNSMASQYGSSFTTIAGYLADTMMEQTLTNAHLAYTAYDAAISAGYSLDKLDADVLEEMNEDIRLAESLGDEYITNYYGKGCNLKNYRNFVEVNTLAQAYLDDQVDAYESTADEKSKYYDEHKDELDQLFFRMYAITVSDTMTLDDAKATVQKMLDESKTDAEAFDRIANEVANAGKEEDEKTTVNTLQNGVRPSTLTEDVINQDVAAWLKDAARKEGDNTMIVTEDNTKVYALYFIEREDQDYTSRDFRAILVSADTLSGKEEDIKKAKEEAQGYLDQFLAGDKTAEAFGELAEKNSDEKVDGGLYENIGHSDIPDAMDEWVYSAERKEGDTTLLEADNGFYVLYYVGEGDNYRETLAGAVLKNEFYKELCEKLIAATPMKTSQIGLNKIGQF